MPPPNSVNPDPQAHAVIVQRASGNFSVGNNTLTAVAFTSEVLDPDNMHDNSTNNTRLTIPAISGVLTGLWHFTALGYTDVTSGRTDCEIKLNGTTFIAFDLRAAATGAAGFFGAGDWVFTAGDYIECFVRTTGGSGNVIFDLPSPTFSCHFLGKVT